MGGQFIPRTNYHSWVSEKVSFEALANMVYISEVVLFSLVCTLKKAIENFQVNDRCTEGGP